MEPDPTQPSTHYVYLLRRANGTIYIGQTGGIAARRARHRAGIGARHTAGIKPVELLYKEGPMPAQQAVSRERQLKKWSRTKKLALEVGDLVRLRQLSQTGKRCHASRLQTLDKVVLPSLNPAILAGSSCRLLL